MVQAQNQSSSRDMCIDNYTTCWDMSVKSVTIQLSFGARSLRADDN